MTEYKKLDCYGIQDVAVYGTPKYVFEYEKTAWELADEVDGEAVAIYQSHHPYAWRQDDYDELEFIGYGVITDNGELL